ncbi:MAG: GTPase HflX [Candidatus Babeliales bacterium]
MAKHTLTSTNLHPNTLIIGIQAPYNRTKHIQSYYDEFESLVETLGVPYEHSLFIKLRAIENAYFVTTGKLEEIKNICEANAIDKVIISEPLSPTQTRNLEDILGAEIIDRTRLILDIFHNAAITVEGKTQVEIAQLHYAKSHLAGRGLFLDQQSGSIGVRGGMGETLKEREKQYIEEQILKLKKHLKKMQQTRETQRKRRLNTGIHQICLIGYTNSGKSTILNTLTKANVLAEDKLFATLDTTTRELFIDGVKIGILSDTVGFIQQLPHHLIEAFKSTLSELQYASLLLQVIDLSDPNWEDHIKVVHAILEDLGVEKEMLYVFNKIDKVTAIETVLPRLELYQPHITISALSREGVKPLLDFLTTWKPNSTQ